MYTVGLINEFDVLKTKIYDNRNKAISEIRNWKNCMINNNVVTERTTIVERNGIDEIIFIKEIINTKNKRYILFMCKADD